VVSVGLSDCGLDNVGFEEDVGMNEALGATLGELSSHMGTSQDSHFQIPFIPESESFIIAQVTHHGPPRS